MPRCPVPLQPTFPGYLSSTLDALVLIEACLQGTLSHVPRRPQDRERPDLIRSGNIFIYEENASGIKRWTDGVNWSPSRILGNFLIYRELEKPFEPGQKKRALKGKQRKGPTNGVTKRSSQSPPGRAGLAATAQGGLDKDLERALVGSLVDSYPFKEKGGLIKKTISIPYRGVLHHVVSYYTTDDVVENRLQLPSESAIATESLPRPELLTRQNFRAPLETNSAVLNFNAQPAMPGYQHVSDGQVPLPTMPGNMHSYRPLPLSGIPAPVPFPGQADFPWAAQVSFMEGPFPQHPQQQLGGLPYGHGSHQEGLLPFDDERVQGHPQLVYHHNVPSST